MYQFSIKITYVRYHFYHHVHENYIIVFRIYAILKSSAIANYTLPKFETLHICHYVAKRLLLLYMLNCH